MLKSAKDWFLRVDTLEQQVPQSVWYGTTFLLIRNTIGSVSYLVEWEWHRKRPRIHVVEEGPLLGKT
jgi:hypothetical protein